MIFGDSHARGLSSKVKNNLGEKYNVCGFVKPGVKVATQISSMTSDTSLLTKNDLIIFCEQKQLQGMHETFCKRCAIKQSN